MRHTLTDRRKLIAWVVLGAAMLLVSVAIATVAIREAAGSQQRTNREICRAMNRLDAVVVATLERSRANLPKLAYFREHPAELRAQKAELGRQIAAFQPRPCDD